MKAFEQDSLDSTIASHYILVAVATHSHLMLPPPP